ncbi:MarR family winged helix-turn-helix transcriptional regulator [Enterococcus sp. CSURQ0835]|uniref:MarR family winged helix-turn-helix transcriptional regulator n=1 Tax=Enterococcus sp. CSURQ0835 TaxID=2681394 RepID=UPI001357E70C|nr:MarR family transcriptional regulator [Enterococcus sp. CSURQ0835]
MENLGYLLMATARSLKYQLQLALTKEDLTVQQWAVLQQLKIQSSNVNQLSIALGMDKPTVSGIVKRLVLKDCITKLQDPNDKRLFHLSLTTQGESRYQQAKEISDHVLTQFMQALAPAEEQLLRQVLQKLEEQQL